MKTLKIILILVCLLTCTGLTGCCCCQTTCCKQNTCQTNVCETKTPAVCHADCLTCQQR